MKVGDRVRVVKINGMPDDFPLKFPIIGITGVIVTEAGFDKKFSWVVEFDVYEGDPLLHALAFHEEELEVIPEIFDNDEDLNDRIKWWHEYFHSRPESKS